MLHSSPESTTPVPPPSFTTNEDFNEELSRITKNLRFESNKSANLAGSDGYDNPSTYIPPPDAENGVVKCAMEADALLASAIQSESDGTLSFQLDRESYNAVIKGWMSVVSHLRIKKTNAYIANQMITIQNASDRAEAWLSKLETAGARMSTSIPEGGVNPLAPNLESYNYVFHALCDTRASDAAEKIEDLVKRMLKYYQVLPDKRSFNRILEAWSYYGGLNPSPQKSMIALERVRRALREMKSLYAKTGDENVKPQTATYNYAMKALDRHMMGVSNVAAGGGRDADTRAVAEIALEIQQLLEEMLSNYDVGRGDLDCKPDISTFMSVVNAWIKCGSDVFPEAPCATEAEAFLKQWQQLYEKTGDNDFRPSSASYMIIIEAWSKRSRFDSVAAKKAEELLHHAEHLSATNKNPDLALNVHAYTSVINAWSRSRDYNKAKRALKILRYMNDKYKETKDEMIRPNMWTYNSAINACAMCQGDSTQQGEALKISFAILKAIKASKKEVANHVTYGTLLKAANNLLPPGAERDAILKAIFENAKKDGQVESGILLQLRNGAGAETFHAITENKITLIEGGGPPTNAARTNGRGRNRPVTTVDEEKIPMEWRKALIMKKEDNGKSKLWEK